MTAAVCVNCQLEMKPLKTGAFVEEMAAKEPYKVWAGDAFKCECCGATVVTRFGSGAVAEHFQEKYQRFAADVMCRAYQRLEDRLEP